MPAEFGIVESSLFSLLRTAMHLCRFRSRPQPFLPRAGRNEGQAVVLQLHFLGQALFWLGMRIPLICTWLLVAAVSLFADPFSNLSFDAASKRAAQTGKIVLVDFYTTWCGPCRLLDKRTWTDADVTKMLEQKTVALRIDAEKQTDLAARYHIDAYPSVLLIQPNGIELGRLVGYRDPKTFLADFNAALKGIFPPVHATAVGTNDPMVRMERGHMFAQRGKDAEALQEYLWCFDHGDEVRSSFDLVRTSTLLGYIKDLGVRYPAARKAIENERDERQTKLLSGPADQHTVYEIMQLNSALDQKEKDLAVFDQLPSGSVIREYVLPLLADQLLAAKRYADILGGGDGKSAFAKQVDLFHDMVDMLNPDNSSSSMYEKSYRNSTVTSGARYFEALAGLKRNREAKELAQRILKFDSSSATRTILAEAAERADNTELAQYVKQ
jgi:thioredoxin-related protein